MQATASDWPLYQAETLRNAAVFTADWEVAAPGRGLILNPVNHSTPSISLTDRKKPDGTYTVLVPRTIERVPGRSVLVGGHSNYYQHLISYILSVYYLRQGSASSTDPIIYTRSNRRFNEDFLDLFGFDRTRVMRPRPGVCLRCEALTLLPKVAVNRGEIVDRRAVLWLRRYLTSKLEPTAARRLYVSRAGATTRAVSNEEKLLAALGRYGFEVLTLETMSVADQAAAFLNAEVVVSAHGAGLSNVVFMPPEALVVELMPRCDKYPDTFKNLARTNCQQFERVISDPAPGEALVSIYREGWRSGSALAAPTFTVEIDKVMATLARLI